MATKNLMNKDAIEKLKELAEKARICMMITCLEERPMPSRPMYLQEVDDEGRLWFISDKTSDKNSQLKQNAELQLTFMNDSNSEYLSIYGKADIYSDQKSIDEHWSIMANAWFDGKEDDSVSIIGVHPIEIKYWDTKHGKIIDMATMLYSALTGDKSVDGGVSGSLIV